MRLEPATMNFKASVLTTQPWEIWPNVWGKMMHSLQKSQWKTSGETAVVMKSQDIKSKFGYIT